MEIRIAEEKSMTLSSNDFQKHDKIWIVVGLLLSLTTNSLLQSHLP